MAKRRGRSKKRTRAKRQQAVETMCLTGPLGSLAGTSTASYYVNAAYILSNLNRKAFHQVTRSGHLKSYGVGISVYNCVNASTAVYTAPNTYVTENAVRAWHFVRKARYAEAGFSLRDLGHGKRLRFALTSTTAQLNQTTDGSWLKPSHLAATISERGEWDLSDVIITPPADPTSSTSLSANDTVDSFVLHLTGDHVEDQDQETLKFKTVGMNQSWLENRRMWSVPGAEQITQPENPLAFARMSELASEAVSEEVGDEQLQQPPYSIDDDDDATSQFAELVLSGQMESQFPNPTTNNDLIVCPGGLAKVSITNNDDSAAYPFVSMQLIELN